MITDSPFRIYDIVEISGLPGEWVVVDISNGMPTRFITKEAYEKSQLSRVVESATYTGKPYDIYRKKGRK